MAIGAPESDATFIEEKIGESPIVEASKLDHSFSTSTDVTNTGISEVPTLAAAPVAYRLYKRRFIGLVALILLNIVCGLPGPWFGPISNSAAAELGITLDEVNWLGNVTNLAYLPSAFLSPLLISRFGIRRSAVFGGLVMLLSGWLRYAGTAPSLSPRGGYALLLLGSIISALPQSLYQVMGPFYSEAWFDLKGRTTATMVVGISNPIGNALGQLISPVVGTTVQSILVLAIICTVVAPSAIFVAQAPPTPPTFAASKETASLKSLYRAMLGLEVEPAAYMTRRERADFAIVSIIFGILVAASISFSILSNQILQPVGYSSDISGFLGATLLLAGLAAAIISAPLFDRVFTHHLAIACKILVPITSLGWFSLIWAVRPNNAPALFVIMAIIGVASIPMLPIGLELACEVTRNTDGSAAIVWAFGNAFGVIFVLCLGYLRASPDASPPLNMKRALICMGVIVLVLSTLIFFLRGEQKRKALDEQKLEESLAAHSEMNAIQPP